MDPNAAGKQVCKITFYTVAILELLGLFIVAGGDFANGILFYIQAQMNPFGLGFFILLFTLSYFLGKEAGRNIAKGSPYLKIGAIYGLLEGVILLGYVLVIANTLGQLPKALQSLPQLSLVIILPVLLLWLFAASEIKKKMNNATID